MLGLSIYQIVYLPLAFFFFFFSTTFFFVIIYKQNSDFILLLSYVDDVIITGNNTTIIQQIILKLRRELALKNLIYRFTLFFWALKLSLSLVAYFFPQNKIHQRSFLQYSYA